MRGWDIESSPTSRRNSPDTHIIVDFGFYMSIQSLSRPNYSEDSGPAGRQIANGLRGKKAQARHASKGLDYPPGTILQEIMLAPRDKH